MSDKENTRAAPQGTAVRPIDQIIVGNRFRRDLGDIAELARSIAETGLLHPIVITSDDRLIAGYRRMHATKLLGLTEIAVTIVNFNEIVRGEYAENSIRKDFTLSEAVAIKRALEPIEREAAQKRMRSGKPLENFSKGNGRALDRIAKVAGISRITLARAEAVVDAAAAEPEKFGGLLAAMDKTGRVNSPYKRLQVAKQAEKIRAEAPPLPGNGPYRVASVDIPWAYEPDGDADRAAHRGVWPYPTMTIDQACALAVAAIMHSDAIIWLWVTNFILAQALHVPVLRAWGFEPKTIITWEKDRAGTGIWILGQTEHAIMAVRGKPDCRAHEPDDPFAWPSARA